MGNIQIFGFGSLINDKSMRRTSPNAENVRPAIISGFKRRFNLWDGRGFKNGDYEVAQIPYCAVDIQPSETGQNVNGVLFSVDEYEFKKLIEREYDYKLIDTEVYDFHDGSSLGTAKVFSAQLFNGSFDYDNPAQERYLQICLDGAADFGNEFFETFIETTLIDNQPIASNYRLNAFIQN